MNNWRVLRVQILDSLNDFSDELRGNALRESTLSLQAGVDLATGRELQNQIEGVIVFVVIVEFNDVLVI